MGIFQKLGQCTFIVKTPGTVLQGVEIGDRESLLAVFRTFILHCHSPSPFSIPLLRVLAPYPLWFYTHIRCRMRAVPARGSAGVCSAEILEWCYRQGRVDGRCSFPQSLSVDAGQTRRNASLV